MVRVDPNPDPNPNPDPDPNPNPDPDPNQVRHGWKRLLESAEEEAHHKGEAVLLRGNPNPNPYPNPNPNQVRPLGHHTNTIGAPAECRKLASDSDLITCFTCAESA